MTEDRKEAKQDMVVFISRSASCGTIVHNLHNSVGRFEFMLEVTESGRAARRHTKSVHTSPTG